MRKMQSGAWFCVDIGGTKTAFAAFDCEGNELFYDCFATASEKGAHSLAARVYEKSAALLREHKVLGGVLASPGPLDLSCGRIINAVLLGWKDEPIAEIFGETFGFPFSLVNDCDAGALGVQALRKGKNDSVLVYVSVSTGIGGGITVNGDLVRGGGNAANFGHIRVQGEGIICGCGEVDCLELYASGSGIEKRYYERTGKSLGCADIAAAARLGDETARALFVSAGEKTARVLKAVCAVLDPDIIVLGGSVIKSRDLFIDEIYKLIDSGRIAFAPEHGKQVLIGAYEYAVRCGGKS